MIGITGTNGKSTVTTLGGAHGGRRRDGAFWPAAISGEPALDLLEQPKPDLYVLELSSFQLETTTSLVLKAAVVLNVTADHLDRYPSVEAYARAKGRIFAKASTVVLNADDPWVLAMRDAGISQRQPRAPSRFPLSATMRTSRWRAAARQIFLARRGEKLLDVARMKISGLHNAANALAALALGDAAGPADDRPCSQALESFPGLSHRSSWVADVGGVRYIDDSKGTNVGATIAAVAGMAGPLGDDCRGRGQGPGFQAAGGRLSRQGARGGADRQGRAGHRGRASRACANTRSCGIDAGRRSARRGERVARRRRHRAAVAGLRELRHVSRLRPSRRCLRGRGDDLRCGAKSAAPKMRRPRCGAMSTATMSYGVRARERMPFAWDTVTLGLVAALLLVGLDHGDLGFHVDRSARHGRSVLFSGTAIHFHRGGSGRSPGS